MVVLSLLGVDTDAEWLDGDLMMLIGIFAIEIPAAIIFAVVHTVRKRKKNNIKRIEIHSKNEDEQDKNKEDGSDVAEDVLNEKEN